MPFLFAVAFLEIVTMNAEKLKQLQAQVRIGGKVRATK